MSRSSSYTYSKYSASPPQVDSPGEIKQIREAFLSAYDIVSASEQLLSSLDQLILADYLLCLGAIEKNENDQVVLGSKNGVSVSLQDAKQFIKDHVGDLDRIGNDVSQSPDESEKSSGKVLQDIARKLGYKQNSSLSAGHSSASATKSAHTDPTSNNNHVQFKESSPAEVRKMDHIRKVKKLKQDRKISLWLSNVAYQPAFNEAEYSASPPQVDSPGEIKQIRKDLLTACNTVFFSQQLSSLDQLILADYLLCLNAIKKNKNDRVVLQSKNGVSVSLQDAKQFIKDHVGDLDRIGNDVLNSSDESEQSSAGKVLQDIARKLGYKQNSSLSAGHSSASATKSAHTDATSNNNHVQFKGSSPAEGRKKDHIRKVKKLERDRKISLWLSNMDYIKKLEQDRKISLWRSNVALYQDQKVSSKAVPNQPAVELDKQFANKSNKMQAQRKPRR